MDEHAALDLYAIGAMAGVFGVCIPALSLLGHVTGKLLVGAPVALTVVVLLALVPVVHIAVCACLRALSPAEGFKPHTKPRKAMWGLCAAGHIALVCGCFYSPDVHGAVGYFLGFVHISRVLKIAFSFPGSSEDGADLMPDTDL